MADLLVGYDPVTDVLAPLVQAHIDADVDTKLAVALSAIAKAVPRWAATTAYTAGDQVVSPNNDVVKRTTTGTSGATYDPTQWQVSATYGRKATFNILDYGASPAASGAANVTAINAALTAAPAGSRVYVPAGVYNLAPDAAWYMLRVDKPNIEMFGDGQDSSVFRVADAAGDFKAMLTNKNAVGTTVDITGIHLHDLGFNQNNTGNTVSNLTTLMSTYYRMGLQLVTYAAGGRVERCHFSDSESVCNINTTDSDNFIVENCVFDGLGPGAYHDHSTLNLRGNGLRVRGNRFVGVGAAAWTAVEIHGSNVIVSDNSFDAMGRMGIAAGTLVLGDDQTWVHNTGKRMCAGIQVWAYNNLTPALVGPAMSRLNISDNNIEIDFDRWQNVATSTVKRTGIDLQVSSSATVDGYRVKNNTITYLPHVTATTTLENQAAGILFVRGGAIVTVGTEDKNVEITGNLIIGSIGPGIYVDGYFHLTGLKILNNTVINPADGCPGSTWFKGIWMSSSTAHTFTMKDIEVRGNAILDTRGTHVITAGIDVGGVDLLVNGRAGGNNVRASDAVVIPTYLWDTAVPWETLVALASTAGVASLRLPHGVAPSTPVDGDMWTTTTGLLVRINGVTKTVTLT